MRTRRLLLIAALTIATIPARPAIGRYSAAGPWHVASRAPSIIDNDDRMDVNDLDMVVTNHGSFAYDLIHGTSGLIYPKGTWKTPVFAAGIWVGAIVGGQVRVALGEYAQDFVPGPMVDSTFVPDQPEFRNYKIVRGNTTSDDYQDWPVSQGAPVDLFGNPGLLGDVMIWSVYNDANPAMHTSIAGHTQPLGVEIRQSVFAFHDGSLGDMIFFRWILSNSGRISSLDSVYVSLWMDPDLGSPGDDLVGCDTTLALGYCYNATNSDAVYGSKPPAVGFQLLQGPTVPQGPVADTLGMTSFTKYIGGTDPQSALESYFLMKGLDRQGQAIHVFDDLGQPATTYAASGLDPSAPSSPTNWLDPIQGEKRLMVSAGPFTLGIGAPQEIRAVLIVGQGNDRLSSIADLRAKAAMAETLTVFDPPSFYPQVPARVDFSPDAVPLRDDSPWVNAFIEGGFRPEEIQSNTVRLANVAPDPNWAVVGDHNGNGVPDLGLRFSRTALAPWLRIGENYLLLTGTLTSGFSFEASDELRVLPVASIVPNPLRFSGWLRFETSTGGSSRLLIFDVTGRLVRTSEISGLQPGSHVYPVPDQGELSTGLYLYRLETPDGTSSGRFVLLK